MPNWPITLNTITEGAIIKASDLEGNFTKLKNAANTLHERFSTLSFNTDVNVFHESKSFPTSTYSYTLCTVTAEGAVDTQGQQAVDDYRAFAVFRVPSFAQALRVREVAVLNNSVMPIPTDYSSIADNTVPLEIGVRMVTNITDWDQNAASIPGTLISLDQFKISDTGGDNTASGYTTSFTGGPTVKTTTPNVLVLGGQYMIVYGRGGIDVGVSGTIAPVHFNFNVNIMCDAMVPIP